MKVLVTGAGGTIGRQLRTVLLRNNIEVIRWDRTIIPINDYALMEDYIRKVNPDVFFHLAYDPQAGTSESWLSNYEWPGELAWITSQLNIRFIFTSTNLVFSGNQTGPFDVNSIPGAESGYGYEKRRAEERVIHQHPAATIIRLGWQIGHEPGSNNMIDYLERKMNENGSINASIDWKPACSFLQDTCEKLFEMIEAAGGVYLLDSNSKWNFFELATALNELHNNRWKITPSNDYKADTRMKDGRLKMMPLNQRLNLP